MFNIKMKQLLTLSLILVAITLAQCKSLDGSTNRLDEDLTGNQLSDKQTNIADPGRMTLVYCNK